MKITIPNPVFYSLWIDLDLCDLRRDARFHPDDETDKLGDSMAIKQLQPIIVCRVADSSAPGGYRYEALAGVGRIIAARKKAWKQIRADVYEGLNELQKLDMIFSENEDRKNASPLYQCQVLNGMLEASKIQDGKPDLDQGELADQIGKDRTTVNKYMSLLNLTPKIWESVNAFTHFSMRHFAQLLRIENKDDQWKLAEISRDKGLSSTELRALVDKQLGVKTGGKKQGRPKGDKTLGPGGFAFKRQKGNILIKGRFEEEKGIAIFLAKMGEGWTKWSQENPKPTRRIKKSAAGSSGPAQTPQGQTA